MEATTGDLVEEGWLPAVGCRLSEWTVP